MSAVQFIKPANSLRKAKIGSGPVKPDQKLLKKAENAVTHFRDNQQGWAERSLTAIDDVYAALRQHSDDFATLRQLSRLVVDIRSDAASFQHPLMVAIADLLADFLQERRALDPRDLAIVETHIAALRAASSREPAYAISVKGADVIAGLKKIALAASR